MPLIVRYGLRIALEESFIGVLLNRVWSFWTSQLEEAPTRTLVLSSLGAGVLETLLALRVQTPPTALLFFQTIGLSLGALPLFWICRQYIGKNGGIAAFLPFLYWSYIPFICNAPSEVHLSAPLPVLLLMAIAGLQESSNKARTWGFFFLLKVLSLKASSVFITIGIGTSWLVGAGPPSTLSFTRKLGLFILVLGLILLGIYPEEFINADPSKLLHLFSYTDQKHLLFYLLFCLLLPLGFLPIANPQAALAALPSLFMLFTTENSPLKPAFILGTVVSFLWALPGAALALSKIQTSKTIELAPGLWIKAWMIFWIGISGIFYVFTNCFNKP